jgi:succinate dehydrogenase/fumarate reductase flavoprotein subunit
MPTDYPSSDRAAANSHELNLVADVLVIGGSLAGCWAAYSARAAGANVVVVEKGYVGTAGVVAAASCGGRHTLPDDPEQRQKTIYQQHDIACSLDDVAFIERVYDECYRVGKKLQALGYAPGGEGPRALTSFPGAYSMNFLRNLLLKSSVRILDNSPALELLTADGEVSGAAGVNRTTGATWSVRAGATILATGGNAFRSGAMGTNGSTGDGYLMAAEVGASFTGMEYSGHYGIAPVNSSCTKGFWYGSATFFDARGQELPGNGWQAVPTVAKAIIETGAAYAQITKPSPLVTRNSGTAFHVYCQRVGLDPIKQKFQVELILEGTVRSVGGLPVDDSGATEVPGLFAVGDVADRTKITGASMSGAGPAIAWCLASGEWAGSAAANYATNRRRENLLGVLEANGRVGLRPTRGFDATLKAADIVKGVQQEILPLDKNCFRHEATLRNSLTSLETLWAAARGGLRGADARELFKAREAAALAATGRWIYEAALRRPETRGLHRRSDHRSLDPAQLHQSRVGGLDRIWSRTEPLSVALARI